MNTIFQQLNQANQMPQNNINPMIQMIKNSKDPQQLISMFANKNPQFAQIMNTLNTGNITPKQLFLNMAQQKGINPNDIISLLK